MNNVPYHVIRRLEEHILAHHGLAGQGSIEFEHRGETSRGYPYVRSGHQPFFDCLVRAVEVLNRPVQDLHFLEIGCGIGTKCLLAHELGLHVTGFDVHQAYVDVARDLCAGIEIETANALDYDYQGFDLIYYHIPLANDDLMFELESRVLTQMDIGAILFNTKLTKQLRQLILDGESKASQAIATVAPRWQATFRLPEITVGRLIALQKTGEFTGFS